MLTCENLVHTSTDVDIWRLSLARPLFDSDKQSSLSCDELARADRFHFERDRVPFVRCRTALRSLLGSYLGIRPCNIKFEDQPNGKPELSAEQNKLRLRFNVSHSAGTALIAITANRRIGVDIEKIENIDIFDLAERFFSERERASLEALPQSLQLEAFFACWTRKEAFLKAIAEGLSFPLADFSVSTHPKIHPKIEEIRGDSGAAQRWFLADVRCDEHYRSAVVVEDLPDRRNMRVEVRDFEP